MSYYRNAERVYNEKRRIAKKICKEKKRKAINKRLQYISKQHADHAVREMYKRLDTKKWTFSLDYIT